MDVYELVKKVGGEIVRGKARVRQGAVYINLGYNDGTNMVFTKEGSAMAESFSAPKPVGRGRPKAVEPVVEAPKAPSGSVEDLMADLEE